MVSNQRSRNASNYFTGHRTFVQRLLGRWASNRNLWLKSVPYTANANSRLVAVCEILLVFLTPGGGPCVSDMLDVGYPLFVPHNECLKDWTNQCFPHMNLSQDSLRCCACVRPWAVAVQVVTYRGSRSQVQFYCADIAPILGVWSIAREIYHERREVLAEVKPHSGAF